MAPMEYAWRMLQGRCPVFFFSRGLTYLGTSDLSEALLQQLILAKKLEVLKN